MIFKTQRVQTKIKSKVLNLKCSSLPVLLLLLLLSLLLLLLLLLLMLLLLRMLL